MTLALSMCILCIWLILLDLVNLRGSRSKIELQNETFLVEQIN